MAYIYQIVNDINNKVYVGKTEYSLQKRFREHCADSTKTHFEKRPLYAAMKKYGVEHFHIELIEETNNPEEREIYWIEQKDSYHNGYNATRGGDGKHYLDYDLILQTWQSEPQSLRTVAKKLNIDPESVSVALKRNSITPKSPQEINKLLLSKPVEMYDKKTGELLMVFTGIQEAADYLIKQAITSGQKKGIAAHISQVCSGKRKSAYGYTWRHVK